MKIHLKLLLAFCVVHQSVWAFVVRSPKSRLSPTFSYVGPQAEGPGQASGSLGGPTPGAPTPGGPLGKGGEMPAPADVGQAGSLWSTVNSVKVQGGSLRTWSFTTHHVERVQVLLKTEGRPLNANVELWQGPDNTPQKMGIYIEDGSLRPFNAIIETPKAMGNAIAIYNTSPLEFPLTAGVKGEVEGGATSGLTPLVDRLSEASSFEIVQGGGTIKTYPFPPAVASVKVMLKTDGRPLNARMELLQGPNNNKQIIEVYTEDGDLRPFYAVIDTPGNGNVVRIVNTAPVEYPMNACVEPYLVDESAADGFGGDEFFIISESISGMRSKS